MVNNAMSFHPRRQTGVPLRVGVVGLGTGTIAALAKQGDSMRFYEINPAVKFSGRQHYLDAAGGEKLSDGLLRVRHLKIQEAYKLYGKS